MMPTAELANQFQTNNPPVQTYLDRLVQNIIVPDNPRLIDAYVGEVWASTEQPSYMQAAAGSENVDLFDPRYAAMPCIEALQLPDASRVSVAAEKNSVNNFLYHIKNTATAIKDGYMEARKPAVLVAKSIANHLTHPLREVPEALAQVAAMHERTHSFSRTMSRFAGNVRGVGDGLSLVTDKAAVEWGLVMAACGPISTPTEPAAQPTTQEVVQEVPTAQPTGAPETAAPATTGAEAAASATPPTMEQLAQGGGFNYESQEELQRNALDYLYNFFFVEQVVNEDGVPGTRFNELGGEISIFPWAGGAWGTSPQLMQTEGQGKPIAYVNFGIKGPARRTSVAGFTEETGILADTLRFGEDGVVYAVVVHPDGSTTDVGMTSRDIVNWQVLQTAQAATETPTEEPTATPAPTETPAPTPTPELVIGEGEVRYEFTDAATGEALAVALPQEWVEVIEQAEDRPNQEYKGVPLAHARIVEDEAGNRQLMVGNIAVAVETGSGWEKNEAVYTIPGYLGFEGVALAMDEYLGSADPETIPADRKLKTQATSQGYVEGLGTIEIAFADNLMPIEATRTHMVVVNEGRVVETAKMKIVFAFRGESGGISTFSATSHYYTYDDDEPARLTDWELPLGRVQARTGFFWAKTGALLPENERRAFLEGNNYEWLMYGFGHLGSSSGVISTIYSGGNIDLPLGQIASVEDNY